MSKISTTVQHFTRFGVRSTTSKTPQDSPVGNGEESTRVYFSSAGFGSHVPDLIARRSEKRLRYV